jgi:DinB superfamily
MSSAAHLAAALERHFSNPEHIAFTNFIVVTDGLTPAQAASVPGERFNSVWAIVNHVWYWQEILLRQLQGQTVKHSDLGAPDGGGWPPAGAPTDDALWQADRQKALTANAALAKYVATLTDADLDSEFKAWACAKHEAVNSIFSHNSYHTCEIISVRHMQGFWVEKT